MDDNKNSIPQTEQQEAPSPDTSSIQTATPHFEQYQPRPLFELTKSDTVFSICAVIISIFTMIFGVFGGFEFGYMLSIVLMTALFIVYFAKSSKAHFFPIICGILSLGNSATFICTSNTSVRFFSVVVSFLLALVCFDGLINGTSKGNGGTLGIFYSAFSSVANIVASVKSLLSNGDNDKKAIAKALIGILCAVPVLIIVIPLLISSDYAFQGMMDNIFSNAFANIVKAIFGILLSIFVISYGFSLKKERVSKMKAVNITGLENAYTISFLSAISVCYLLYLFSQLAYFFSAFRGFLPFDHMTYSEYARKGFFEMCVIAVINLIIVFSALLFSKKHNGKVCHAIKAITTFISAFTMIIIATAISKMILYINEYGMTVLRLTTSAFMLFLAVVFISVILRIYTTKINIIKTALTTAGCILLVLGTCNVDTICAKYNYEGYMNNRLETIDVDALYSLGDEGIPYIVKLASCNRTDASYEAQEYLSRAYLYDYFDNMHGIENFTAEDLKQNRKTKSFEHFNLPEAKAYHSLYEFIEQNPDFSSICQNGIYGISYPPSYY